MDMIRPEEVGFSPTRLSRIGKAMQNYVDQKRFSGVVTLVARRGRIVHFESFGMMDIETNKPMQLDTIFRIYSMTKPITSVAVMMLYEEGRFQLNDPVSRFIPEFKHAKVFVRMTESGPELADLERDVTIWHLLTHTSGLSYGSDPDLPVDAMYQEAQVFRPDETLGEGVRKLAKLPLAHQPDSIWQYSYSTDVLAYLVEVLSGMPFDAFLKQRILEPLGMDDTGFYVPEEKIDRFATVYGPTEKDGLEVLETPATSEYSRPRRLVQGGTGLVSTTIDYMRFSQMLLNRGELDGTRLLGRKTVELMTTNHMPSELLPLSWDVLQGFGFGLGFGVLMNVPQSKCIGSEGTFLWGGRFTTLFWVDPREELIGLLMPSTSNMAFAFLDFIVLTYQAIVG